MGDIQLWLELSRHGRIVPIRESLATYRVITESASRSRDHRKIFKFCESALNLSEHYVKKFGYDADVLHQVRMSQFWGMFQIVMKNQDEELREQLRSLLDSRSMEPTGTFQKFAFWALESQSNVNRCAPFAPLFFMAQKIHFKLRVLPGRLRYHWGE
jgi:hypothetical protein